MKRFRYISVNKKCKRYYPGKEDGKYNTQEEMEQITTVS